MLHSHTSDWQCPCNHTAGRICGLNQCVLLKQVAPRVFVNESSDRGWTFERSRCPHALALAGPKLVRAGSSQRKELAIVHIPNSAFSRKVVKLLLRQTSS